MGKVEIVLLNCIKNNGYRWVGTMAKSGGYLYNNLMVLEAINDHIAEYK